MDPLQHYLKKYVDLYKHIDDAEYLRQEERFASWYESPIDLPGRVYLQVVDQLFKQNQFARGEYVALGKKLSLGKDSALRRPPVPSPTGFHC
jgi:poly-beta-hydroxyalkanoate depolymerase